jgi:leader peptidase (prepilin peptidase)/N-methyltransferase
VSIAALIPAVLFAVAGLVFGSFLNVCIVRLPQGESVVRPRSHCRNCFQPILNRDNIPLLSWIILKGRCRHCHAYIGFRYLFVEAATCVLFFLCWLKFGATPEAILGTILCCLLLGLAFMDAETMLLPDRFTIPGLILGIMATGIRAGFASPQNRLVSALKWAGASALDAAIAAIFLLLVVGAYWLVRQRVGMGMGDVKLLAMLAAWLGLVQTALLFFIAAISGAAFGIGLSLFRKNMPAPKPLAIPFGAFLSAAGIYCLFLADRTLQWYMHVLR